VSLGEKKPCLLFTHRFEKVVICCEGGVLGHGKAILTVVVKLIHLASYYSRVFRRRRGELDFPDVTGGKKFWINMKGRGERAGAGLSHVP